MTPDAQPAPSPGRPDPPGGVRTRAHDPRTFQPLDQGIVRMPAPRQVPGRRLGWSADDLATLPYARFWNPDDRGLRDARHAVDNSPMAEALFPR